MKNYKIPVLSFLLCFVMLFFFGSCKTNRFQSVKSAKGYNSKSQSYGQRKIKTKAIPIGSNYMIRGNGEYK